MCPSVEKRILCKGNNRHSNGRACLLCWQTAVQSVLPDWACWVLGGDGVTDLADQGKELAFWCLTFYLETFSKLLGRYIRVVQKMSAYLGCKLPGRPVNIPPFTTHVYLWCVPIACSLNSEDKLHPPCLFPLKMQWLSPQSCLSRYSEFTTGRWLCSVCVCHLSNHLH